VGMGVSSVFCADVGRAHPLSDFPLVCIVFVDEAVNRADRWMFWTCVLAFRFVEPGGCRDSIQRALTIHSRDLRDAVKKLFRRACFEVDAGTENDLNEKLHDEGKPLLSKSQCERIL